MNNNIANFNKPQIAAPKQAKLSNTDKKTENLPALAETKDDFISATNKQNHSYLGKIASSNNGSFGAAFDSFALMQNARTTLASMSQASMPYQAANPEESLDFDGLKKFNAEGEVIKKDGSKLMYKDPLTGAYHSLKRA